VQAPNRAAMEVSPQLKVVVLCCNRRLQNKIKVKVVVVACCELPPKHHNDAMM